MQPPSPPPDSPIINGSSVKGWSVHVGIGAHRARLAALRESVGFLGKFGSRNREGSVGHNWGRRRHKAAARERPNRGRDDESPSRAEERKNKDATTHPATHDTWSLKLCHHGAYHGIAARRVGYPSTGR